MSDPVRWGIIGAGFIASVFARDLELSPAGEVVAVASRRQTAGREFADTHGIPNAYDSYAALLEDASVEAVYIAVPHTEHFQAARDAIRAGKAVLVEKPFTVTLAEARALIYEARQSGVFLMEAHWSRFLPHMRALDEIIADGEVGDVRTITADHGLRFDPQHPEHRLFRAELGGGALLDLGVYAIGFAAALLGDELDIRALGTLTPSGVDAETSAIIRDEHGRHAVITTSLSSELANRACVAGTAGRIEIGYDFMAPNDLTVEQLGDGNPAKTERQRVVPGRIEGHGIRFEAEEVARCIRTDQIESERMPHDLTLKIMGIMDEIRRQIGVRYAADEAEEDPEESDE
jgi:predicted dehydrogenase